MTKSVFCFFLNTYRKNILIKFKQVCYPENVHALQHCDSHRRQGRSIHLLMLNIKVDLSNKIIVVNLSNKIWIFAEAFKDFGSYFFFVVHRSM